MQIKLITTREILHLAPFWKWGFLELGNGPLPTSGLTSLQLNNLKLQRFGRVGS